MGLNERTTELSYLGPDASKEHIYKDSKLYLMHLTSGTYDQTLKFENSMVVNLSAYRAQRLNKFEAEDTEFYFAKFAGLEFNNCKMKNVKFINSDLTFVKFNNCIMDGVTYKDSVTYGIKNTTQSH